MPGKDDLLPLDVHYDRMIEWMVDRSTLPTKWSEGVSRCRELLEPLLADLPPRAEIKALLRDPSEMSYFDCRRIFEVLLEEAKQAGDAGKTLFGSYANARLKAWDALLSAFRKKNVFLGDAARLLVQRTDHEIPAIKASCAQHSQQIQELTRKATETTRNAGETERKLAAACAKVGIDGVSYRSELAALVSELPALLVRVDSATRNEHVVAGAQYYRAFTAFIREAPVVGRAAGGGRAGGKAGKGTSGAAAALASEEPTAPDALLPSLQRYMELDVVRSDVADSADGAGGDSGAAGAAKGESGGEVEIDWGIDVSGGDNGAGDSGGGGGGVDWGIEASGGDTGDAPAGTAATAKEVEINWDLSVDGGRDAGGSRGEIEIDWGGGDDAGGGIDWGGGGGDDAGAAAGAGGGEGGGDACEAIEATDTTASAILQDSSLRVKLVDDLMELEGFLAQRLTEMRDEADLTFADQFASANALVQKQTAEAAEAELAAVKAALEELNSPRLYQLIMIKQGGRYLDRLAESFAVQKAQVHKLRDMAADMHAESDRHRATLAKAYPQVEALVALTLGLKRDCEEALSELYDGRPMHLVGKIANLKV